VLFSQMTSRLELSNYVRNKIKTLREEREQSENSLGVMYRQSGQELVRVHLNSVGIDGQARRKDR
jgi:hypothetical protein